MDTITFGIVGAGWRTEFFMRVARALPERFNVAGVVVRNDTKRQAFDQRWGCKVFATVDELLNQTEPLFVVTSVPWPPNPGIIKQLVARGVAVLSETPPAPDVEQMTDLYNFVQEHDGKVQVAEQLHLRPNHAAWQAVIDSAILGPVSQAQISVAHGYHGISLIRRALGITYEDATITATATKLRHMQGPGRAGLPEAEKIIESDQKFFRLDFDPKLGLMDFTGAQYFSWILASRLLIRGVRGEIHDGSVAYLKDHHTPIYADFKRQTAGVGDNLETSYLKYIQFGDEVVYTNPLAPAALSDDEIAVGTCLLKMADYVKTGNEFYPLAHASQDHYLSIMCESALKTGQTVRTAPQVWRE